MVSSRGKWWAVVVAAVAAMLVVGPWLVILLVQLALLPLLAMWLPYLKILPTLYGLRRQQLLVRHGARLCGIEEALDRSADPDEVRRCLQELDLLRQRLRELARQFPAEIIPFRLHLDSLRRAAVEKLRPVATSAFGPRRRPQRLFVHAGVERRIP